MKYPLLSIVIPAFDEANRIFPLLNEINDSDIEYIFICDGTDNTPDIIRKYATENSYLNITCYTFPTRLGKGGGIYTGFTKASAPIIGFVDADNSTPITEITRLFHLLDQHDGIIGSRHLPGQVIHRRQPLARRIQSRIFNAIIRLMFGLPFHDTQCGAKLFRKEAIDAVLPHLRSRGFEFDVEFLWQLKKKGYSVIEAPVIWNDTGDSRLRMRDSLSMFYNLLLIRMNASSYDS